MTWSYVWSLLQRSLSGWCIEWKTELVEFNSWRPHCDSARGCVEWGVWRMCVCALFAIYMWRCRVHCSVTVLCHVNLTQRVLSCSRCLPQEIEFFTLLIVWSCFKYTVDFQVTDDSRCVIMLRCGNRPLCLPVSGSTWFHRTSHRYSTTQWCACSSVWIQHW